MLQTHEAPWCTAQCRVLVGVGSRGACGSPPADKTSEKKQMGMRGKGAQERGTGFAEIWGGKECRWLRNIMNLLSRQEDERAL